MLIRRLRFVFILTFFSLIYVYILNFTNITHRLPTLFAPNPQPFNVLSTPGLTRTTLHVLLPVTSPSALFCKVLFSAHANGYPAPLLVNYGKKYEKAEFARADKIRGLSLLLGQLAGKQETTGKKLGIPEVVRTDAYVLIIDGFDVWFQLPPQILLARYTNLTYSSAENPAVVFGADKECWPNPQDSPACINIPNSTLPKDAYGPDTDKDPWHYKSRPRYLNSGTVLGRVDAARSIYDAALQLVIASKDVWSDQGILADIFGQSSKPAPMTLDYRSALFQTMTHSHDDIKFSRQTEAGFRGRFLARNVVSGEIPVLLHFNGPKEYLEMWWRNAWFFHENSSARDLLRKDFGAWYQHGKELEWKWAGWDELCGQFEDEILEHDEVTLN